MSNLKAIKRENTSTGSTNKLRANGFIPAILYGGKDPNQKISIEKNIRDIINSDNFLSKVLELDIDGKKEKVLPRDVAYNVISEEPIHIDFMRVVTGKKIVLEIPVKFINHPDSPGLKKGGVLNIVRRAVELKCPAENIPSDITIDLKGTDIGTSLKISSVKLPNNVIPTITDRDFVIATVAAPTIIKEPEKPAEESAEGVRERLHLKEQKLQLKMEIQLKKTKKEKMLLLGIKNLMIKKPAEKNPEKKPPEKK